VYGLLGVGARCGMILRKAAKVREGDAKWYE